MSRRPQEPVCGGVAAGLGWDVLGWAGLGSASVRFIIEFVAA